MKPTYDLLDPSSRQPPRARGCALAMMIKAPRAGSSKTRLVPPLTHDEAAALSVCFLRDTAQNIDAARRATGGAARGVAVYTPVGAESAFDGLLPADFSLLAQRGEGFGERLLNAAADLLGAGFDSLCLIDSDSPTLPTHALVAAVAELSRPGDRVVLGPADDGGYYLVGLKAAHARLFAEIDWSTARVLAQTVERAREIDLPVVRLPDWYDVDDAATLQRLCRELFDEDERGERAAGGYIAPHTRYFLTDIIMREGRARIWPEGARLPGGEIAETRDASVETRDATRAGAATLHADAEAAS